MIGHHTRLRENDDFPLWRGPAVKKMPPFFNAPALITREIIAVGMRNAILGNNLKGAQSRYKALTNRVRGPHCKLRTEFFSPSIYMAQARCAHAINRRGKNADP